MKFTRLMPALLLLAAAMPASAGELDLLLDRLAVKGVLDSAEVAEVRESARTRAAAAARSKKDDFRLKADFRVNYEYSDNQNMAHARHRGRYRLRFGAEAPAGEKFRVAFGLAGGAGADSRSVNQTMGGNFEKKSVHVDYAYAEYGDERAAVSGGRMKNPLWTPTDMAWDSDINPEGIAVRVGPGPGKPGGFSVCAGFLVLDEDAAAPGDPYMGFIQPGLAYASENKAVELRASAAFYAFGHVRGGPALANRPAAAGGYQAANEAPGGLYAHGYDAVHPSVELTFAPQGREGAFSVFGEHIKNTTVSRRSAGWIAGARVGWRKVEAAGQWQFRWTLRRLAGDAWLDTYPDSDFYGGATGVRGQEFLLSFAVAPGAVLEADYYRSVSLLSGKGERLLQAGVNIRL